MDGETGIGVIQVFWILAAGRADAWLTTVQASSSAADLARWRQPRKRWSSMLKTSANCDTFKQVNWRSAIKARCSWMHWWQPTSDAAPRSASCHSAVVMTAHGGSKPSQAPSRSPATRGLGLPQSSRRPHAEEPHPPFAVGSAKPLSGAPAHSGGGPPKAPNRARWVIHSPEPSSIVTGSLLSLCGSLLSG